MISVALLLLSVAAVGQQQADATFDASVKNPAHTATHPKVLFDEAHFNFHTAGGRYKPLADLITNDGYRITSNREKFAAQSLNGFDALVIANAGGGEEPRTAARPPSLMRNARPCVTFERLAGERKHAVDALSGVAPARDCRRTPNFIVPAKKLLDLIERKRRMS